MERAAKFHQVLELMGDKLKGNADYTREFALETLFSGLGFDTAEYLESQVLTFEDGTQVLVLNIGYQDSMEELDSGSEEEARLGEYPLVMITNAEDFDVYLFNVHTDSFVKVDHMDSSSIEKFTNDSDPLDTYRDKFDSDIISSKKTEIIEFSKEILNEGIKNIKIEFGLNGSESKLRSLLGVELGGTVDNGENDDGNVGVNSAEAAEALKNLEAEKEAFETEKENLETEKEHLEAEREALDIQRESFEANKLSLAEERENLVAEREVFDSARMNFEDEKKALDEEKAALEADREAFKAEKQAFAEEKESLMVGGEADTEELENLKAEKEAFESEKEAFESEKEALAAEKEALEVEKQNLETEKEALEAEKENIGSEKEALAAEKEAFDKDHEALDADREAFDSQKAEVEAQREAVKKDEEALEVAKELFKSEKDALKKERELFQTEKSEFNQRFEEFTNEKKAFEESKAASVTESNVDVKESGNNINLENFVNKIRTLEEDNVNLKEKLRLLEMEKEQLQKDLESATDSPEKKAEELLALITDSPDMERNYVGVINDDLFQHHELSKYVGECISRLYSLKQFEAQPYIYNGGIFKLVKPAKRNDVVIGTSQYDIDIRGISEDEVLNRLKVMFSHFDDVVFRCKKIGKLREEDKTLEKREVYEEYYEEEEEQRKLLVATVGQAIELLDEPRAGIKGVRYLGNNDFNFFVEVKSDDGEVDYNAELRDCISSLMSFEIRGGRHSMLGDIKRVDLSTVSPKFCELRSSEVAKRPIRIAGSRYCVKDVRNVRELAEALQAFCVALNIKQSSAFMWFESDTDDPFILEQWGIADGDVPLGDETEYVEDGEITTTSAVFRGDFFVLNAPSINALKVSAKIVIRPTSVRTSFSRNTIKSSEDVQEVIYELIEEALRNGKKLNYKAIGAALGEKYLIISPNIQETNKGKPFDFNGETYYISEVPDTIAAQTIIAVYTAMFGNANIAVQVELNAKALVHYAETFATFQPNYALGVYSFLDYVRSCIKN